MSDSKKIEGGKGSRVIVALDNFDHEYLLSIVEQLTPADCRLKIGKEMFCRRGPDLVRTLVERGFDVFLDLKFHDIPNTVAQAVRAAAELDVWMVNVHASGGRRMMTAAAEALRNSEGRRPLLTAVTVLTSMEASDLIETGITVSPEDHVMRLAQLAFDCGLDGVVCSAQEAPLLKSRLGKDFLLVTPGVRPEGSAAGDQRRTATPLQAVAMGSDYLVIGRPVTQALNPQATLAAINAEIGVV
jgi:orotidine-5'-phosphate decarboxylase